MSKNEIAFVIFYAGISVAGVCVAIHYWYYELYKKREGRHANKSRIGEGRSPDNATPTPSLPTNPKKLKSLAKHPQKSSKTVIGHIKSNIITF